MWRVAYKVSDVVVDSTPAIFVSDSVDGSVDSGMSDIMIESNYSIHFSVKWYLQVFDTAVFSCWNSRKKWRKYQNLIQGYQVSTNLH